MFEPSTVAPSRIVTERVSGEGQYVAVLGGGTIGNVSPCSGAKDFSAPEKVVVF